MKKLIILLLIIGIKGYTQDTTKRWYQYTQTTSPNSTDLFMIYSGSLTKNIQYQYLNRFTYSSPFLYPNSSTMGLALGVSSAPVLTDKFYVYGNSYLNGNLKVSGNLIYPNGSKQYESGSNLMFYDATYGTPVSLSTIMAGSSGYTFSNLLTKLGSNVTLGGDASQNTTLRMNAHTLIIANDISSLTYSPILFNLSMEGSINLEPDNSSLSNYFKGGRTYNYFKADSITSIIGDGHSIIMRNNTFDITANTDKRMNIKAGGGVSKIGIDGVDSIKHDTVNYAILDTTLKLKFSGGVKLTPISIGEAVYGNIYIDSDDSLLKYHDGSAFKKLFKLNTSRRNGVFYSSTDDPVGLTTRLNWGGPFWAASLNTSGKLYSDVIKTNGTTQAAGYWDNGTTDPTHTTRLNYDGLLYSTGLNCISGSGIFASRTTGSTIDGRNTAGEGGHFEATSGDGLYASAETGRAAYIQQSSSSLASLSALLYLNRTATMNNNISISNPIIDVADNSTVSGSGVDTAAFLKYRKGTDLRINMNPEIANGANLAPFMFRTTNSLTANSKLFQLFNGGVEKLYSKNDTSLVSVRTSKFLDSVYISKIASASIIKIPAINKTGSLIGSNLTQSGDTTYFNTNYKFYPSGNSLLMKYQNNIFFMFNDADGNFGSGRPEGPLMKAAGSIYYPNNPSYTWQNDLNTGMGRPASDSIYLIAGNNRRLKISSTYTSVKCGTSYTDATVGGVLKDFYVDSTTRGTTETVLYSYSVPGGVLSGNGDKLSAKYAMQYSSGIGVETDVWVYFADDSIYIEHYPMNFTTIDVQIIRTSASTARMSLTLDNYADVNYVGILYLTGKDWTTSNILKLTAKCASGSSKAVMGYIEYKPAAKN